MDKAVASTLGSSGLTMPDTWWVADVSSAVTPAVAEGFTDIGGAVTVFFYGSSTDPIPMPTPFNSFDEVVGRYYDSSNKSHGFYRDARATITSLMPTGRIPIRALESTMPAKFTGNYIDISGISHGFTDINGKFATTDFYSTAGVNNEMVFVGYYFGVRGVVSGYLASPESFEVPTPRFRKSKPASSMASTIQVFPPETASLRTERRHGTTIATSNGDG